MADRPRAFRHELSFLVGFRGDPRLYPVINWSRTGMLVDYEGPLMEGEEGVLDRIALEDETDVELTKPRHFRVIRRRGPELAIDFPVAAPEIALPGYNDWG